MITSILLPIVWAASSAEWRFIRSSLKKSNDSSCSHHQNRGSFVATKTAKLFGRFFRPVAELTTEKNSLVNSLDDPSDVEVGIIAAEQDALVSLESTRLEVPHEHITLPCLHSAVLFREDAANLIHSFLKNGTFRDAAAPATYPEKSE